MDPIAIERAFKRIVAARPDAAVAAVGPNGLFVDIPCEVVLKGQQALQARAGIELVAPESRATVLEQFRQLGGKGATETEVRMASGNPGRYALFDTRAVYGVVMLVVSEEVAGAQSQPALTLAGLDPIKPRYGRIKRSQYAELLDVDEAVLRMLGYRRDQFAALDTSASVHGDDYDALVGQWFDLLTTEPGSSRRVRVRYRCADGGWLWVELTITQRLDDPAQPHMVVEVVDISEEMAAIDEVWRSRELLHRLTEALPVGVLQIDAQGSVVHSNDRLHQILRVPHASTFAEQLSSILDDDRQALERTLQSVLVDGADTDLECRSVTPGQVRLAYLQLAFRALRDRVDGIAGAIICVTDVTDSTCARQELEARASRDALTGCRNRAAVLAEIEHAVACAGQGTAVVFVDLDGFKPVNDRLGHAAGDQVLRTVAAALQRTVREHDVVGRLGGDEFLVLCPHVPDPALAEEIAQRIATAARLDTTVEQETVAVQASVGVAWSARPEGPEALVAAADTAMYRAKQAGDGKAVLITC